MEVATMTSKKRFLIGGGGALMPVLISILAIDVGTMINSESALNAANIIGISIRYLVLFVIGGVVAYLQTPNRLNSAIYINIKT